MAEEAALEDGHEDEASEMTSPTITDSFVFFFGKASPFSQHHASNLTIDGKVFNCAEQYMMYSKAVLFKDDKMRDEIMASTNPVEQNRYGRKVQNFDKDIWTAKAEEVVRTATKAKFEQNRSLRKQLFATHPKVLAEANPRDRIWGIGLGASNPKACDRSQWRGKNKLGDILTQVRNEMMEEQASDEESEDDMQDVSETAACTTTDSFVFFFGKASPFSQHHPSSLVVDGKQFNCAEQYMMYSKAVLFKDDKMRDEIMASTNPVEQNRYGRKVQNFDKDIWTAKAEEVVRTATIAKFEQHDDLRKQLFATHPKTLAEANPRDRIWGIGLGASNPKACDRSQWRGKNKLGDILTQVRNEMMEEEKNGED